jgi:hypothetical protein
MQKQNMQLKKTHENFEIFDNVVMEFLFYGMKRIQKFSDDCILLCNGGNINKLKSEMNKLAIWMQKHQNETVPDNAKSKLLTTIETYYRLRFNKLYNFTLDDVISNLISFYLQMPEGKLLSAKDKKKVLFWYTTLNSEKNNESTLKSVESVNNSFSDWTIESYCEKENTFTLLNVSNVELWKEDFKIVDTDKLNVVKLFLKNNKSFILRLSNNFNVTEVIEEI